MYRFYRYKKERPHYDPTKTFYVCSYGGSGSQMLCHYLGHFGNIYHIHSRVPPIKLTKTGYDQTTYTEWFNTTEIKESEIKNYKVLFIYRDPVKAIYSRFNNKSMFVNIQAPLDADIPSVIEQKKDLVGLEDFFDQYTRKPLKNYSIYCVKYESLWEKRNLTFFNKEMNIQDLPDLYPIQQETQHEPEKEELNQIYKSLQEKMNKMKFLEIR
jgi:hypothetical protein